MKKQSNSATSLKELINHAITDFEITPAEYQRIIDLAHEDGHIDQEEKALLAHFHEMLNSGMIKRVRG